MIYHGDSLDVLKTIPDESVDLLLTDPPYGISFMSRGWDKALPDIGIFKECFRVLKPGAFAFVMSAPRSDVCSRMMILLEDSGFDIGFTPLYHTYASGFPKAQNVHKKLTKDEEARKCEVQELWRAVIHSSTPTEQSEHGSYLSSLLEDLEQGEQCEISSEDFAREEIQVSEGQKKSCLERWPNLSEEERKLWGCEVCTMPRGFYVNGTKRWVCYGTPNRNGDFTWEVVDENGSSTSYKSRLHGQSFRKLDALCKQCRTQKIRTLNGAFSGFQPKPAVEVIIVAMKPLSEKTYVDQALKNGKGITWLDDCRVPTDEDISIHAGNVFAGNSGVNNASSFKTPGQERGRFPANLLVENSILDTISCTCTPEENTQIAKPDWSWGEGGTEATTQNESHEARKQSAGLQKPYEASGSLPNTVPLFPAPDTNSSTSEEGKNDAATTETASTTFGERQSFSATDAGAFSAEQSEKTTEVKDSTPTTSSPTHASQNSATKSQTAASCALHATGKPTPTASSQQYSRFFSLDAWAQTLPFLIVPKASKREKNEGLEEFQDETVGDGRQKAIDNAFQRGKTERKNVHPTVKPLKLMSYLITLGSRPGDTVLDPFLGSGTTAIAAKQLGRECIGIEREREYVEIAEARLKAVPDALI